MHASVGEYILNFAPNARAADDECHNLRLELARGRMYFKIEKKICSLVLPLNNTRQLRQKDSSFKSTKTQGKIFVRNSFGFRLCKK